MEIGHHLGRGKGAAMTPLSCSFFNSALDNQPHPFTGTWHELQDRLSVTRHTRRGAVGNEAKKSLPAISGTIFKPGTRRARENALSLGLLIFDFDNGIEVPTGEFWPDLLTGRPSTHPKLRKEMIVNPATFEEVQVALRVAGVNSYSWTTWSHSPKWPRFRVLIPLATAIPAQVWEATIEWSIESLGFGLVRRGLDLPVLRDIARLNFLPGAPCPVMIERGETRGDHFQVPLKALAQVIGADVPHVLDRGQERGPRSKGDYAWAASLRIDLTTLRLADLIASWGIKVGPARPYRGGTKWRTNCLWPEEHTHGLDDDSGFVIHEVGRWPTWSCSHSCHTGLGLVDVLRAIGVI